MVQGTYESMKFKKRSSAEEAPSFWAEGANSRLVLLPVPNKALQESKHRFRDFRLYHTAHLEY